MALRDRPTGRPGSLDSRILMTALEPVIHFFKLKHGQLTHAASSPFHRGLVLLQVGTALVTPTDGQLYVPIDGAVTVPIDGPELP